MGAIFLNPAAFGELVVIVHHIEAEPVVVQFWSEIHPRIVNVSHELYVDGHYSTAAEKAVKEVESRLRDKFLELRQHRINGRIHIGGHAFCENQQDALCICSQGRTDSSCQAGPVSQNQIR